MLTVHGRHGRSSRTFALIVQLGSLSCQNAQCNSVLILHVTDICLDCSAREPQLSERTLQFSSNSTSGLGVASKCSTNGPHNCFASSTLSSLPIVHKEVTPTTSGTAGQGHFSELFLANRLCTDPEMLPCNSDAPRDTTYVPISPVFSTAIIFVDSNPAKFSLIRGTSESKAYENIIRCISILDASDCIWAWYCRVPTKSNLADWPSRFKFPEETKDFRVLRCDLVQPISLKDGVWSDLWKWGVTLPSLILKFLRFEQSSIVASFAFERSQNRTMSTLKSVCFWPDWEAFMEYPIFEKLSLRILLALSSGLGFGWFNPV